MPKTVAVKITGLRGNQLAFSGDGFLDKKIFLENKRGKKKGGMINKQLNMNFKQPNPNPEG